MSVADVLPLPPTSMPKTREVRVMIVEDDPSLADLIRDVLEEFGYFVLPIVRTALDALRLAGVEPVDIALVDVRIEGELDGIDLACILRARLDVPVVFVSAHADSVTLDRAKAARPFGYVVKPCTAASLNSAIVIAVQKHHSVRTLLQRERALSTSVKLVDEGVITADREGRVLSVNPAAQTLVGLGLIQGADLRSADALSGLADPLRRALENGEFIEHASRNHLDETLASRVAPVFDESGRVIGVVVMVRKADGAPRSVVPPPRESQRGKDLAPR